MNNKGTTLLIVILSILVIVAGGMLIYKIINEKEESENVVADDNVDINEDKDDKELVVEEKKPQIFNGNDRPIAVMIDNHSGAWPQANLNKAYLVYEIIVEGGETRLMAVFKGQDLEKIGPIRSSRHYFLDYALENDAIYVHHGWSPQAQNDISALNVNNINGIQESSNNFWRVKDKKSPHNMFTSTTSILKIAERKGYATISDKKSVLNYIASDVDLKEKYGIEEEDFMSAELEAVPAGPARDYGIDRSMIIGYGHDDRVCAYPSLIALVNADMPKRTGVCILVDKEEIGSVGATGMQSHFFENTVAEIMNAMGGFSEISLRRCLASSRMLSSDVSAGFDPTFESAFDKKNAAIFGEGMVFNKFTGSRGKSGSTDANAEYMAAIRKIMDDAEITYQTAELGKVDVGGGGTIAYILSLYGMEVIDCGVAVLNMHAPWEVTSKADIYETKKGYVAFLKEA